MQHYCTCPERRLCACAIMTGFTQACASSSTAHSKHVVLRTAHLPHRSGSHTQTAAAMQQPDSRQFRTCGSRACDQAPHPKRGRDDVQAQPARQSCALTCGTRARDQVPHPHFRIISRADQHELLGVEEHAQHHATAQVQTGRNSRGRSAGCCARAAGRAAGPCSRFPAFEAVLESKQVTRWG